VETKPGTRGDDGKVTLMKGPYGKEKIKQKKNRQKKARKNQREAWARDTTKNRSLTGRPAKEEDWSGDRHYRYVVHQFDREKSKTPQNQPVQNMVTGKKQRQRGKNGPIRGGSGTGTRKKRAVHGGQRKKQPKNKKRRQGGSHA